MKKFCEFLREHAIKILKFKKKKVKLLTKKKKSEVINKRAARIILKSKNIFVKENLKDKKYGQVRDHCHYTGK